MNIFSPLLYFNGKLILGPINLTWFIFALNLYLSYAVLAGILKIIIPIFKIKESRFYYAKAFLELASKEKDETLKISYLNRGIRFYDKYLRRNLNLQINDIEEVYSMLIIGSKINENIESLSKSFKNDNEKLKPTRCLSQITNVQEPKKFLITLSLWDKVKDLAVFFATIIPVITAVVTGIQFVLSLIHTFG